MIIIETENDLMNLIQNKIPEDTSLDYKTPEFSKGGFSLELAKDVSAMANSEGGVIIYGIKEENHFPKEIIWIKIDEDKGYQEQIEQIISSKIYKKIEEIKIKKVISDDKTKFVIVINIPQSDIAPHQVHKDSEQRRYYKRNGSITRQMEEYEISDLFFKRKSPILKLIPQVKFDLNRTIIDLSVLNLGKVIAEKTLVSLKIPFNFELGSGWMKTEDLQGVYKKFEYFQSEIPFYPNIISAIGTLQTTKNKTRAKEVMISFMIVCEGMPLRKGELIIKNDFPNKPEYIEKIYQQGERENNPYWIIDEYQ